MRVATPNFFRLNGTSSRRCFGFHGFTRRANAPDWVPRARRDANSPLVAGSPMASSRFGSRSLALAVLFYFIPKLADAPLHSRALVVLGFWSLAVFGCWAGFYRGLPLPAWMVRVGIAGTMVLIVPLIATASNLWLTLGAGRGARRIAARLL